MYTIINKTKNNSINIAGSYPSILINTLLDDGNDIIIISLYSDVIKIPFKDENGHWTNKEYNIPTNLLKQ